MDGKVVLESTKEGNHRWKLVMMNQVKMKSIFISLHKKNECMEADMLFFFGAKIKSMVGSYASRGVMLGNARFCLYPVIILAYQGLYKSSSPRK
jgi:hypothetical protein